MRIHRLNCIGTRPHGGRLIDGLTRGMFTRGRCVSHCLLVETGEGLLLVDTGLGTGDVMDPERRLSPIARKLLAPDLRADMTAVRQVERMGFRGDDVRDIVLTHLDFDQAGGLDDFPHARVHVLAKEVAHAAAQDRWGIKQRYRPAQWSTRTRWIQYDALSDVDWKGMPCVRDLAGLPPDLIVLVPLPGHTPGHVGVAISGENGWHLHCGDAYGDARELDSDPHGRWGMQAYESLTATDRALFAHTQHKLRQLHYKHPDVIMNCAKDPREFERLAGRAAHLPADPITPMPRDPYVEKIVRKPRPEATVLELLPTRGATGLEVVDHDTATFDLEPFRGTRNPAPPQPSS
ncbi:Beta-lactamase-like protein [Lysobacter dokdonensis DS-58]|uniref:Beta-lactamase-like protein n=1 Tax=Lysobacter dokdonensis DS-58 TaxID=1300345 RepID=A0A0A2WP32_9GAMM|nr:MBL fold metallo-hydrolase [Lysobacter dokdonensis]KGQ20497.1 Beta-lactamase-like protein [Lysobacter dokdonensis DS-58]